jgi:hypothetical protein
MRLSLGKEIVMEWEMSEEDYQNFQVAREGDDEGYGIFSGYVAVVKATWRQLFMHLIVLATGHLRAALWGVETFLGVVRRYGYWKWLIGIPIPICLDVKSIPRIIMVDTCSTCIRRY